MSGSWFESCFWRARWRPCLLCNNSAVTCSLTDAHRVGEKAAELRACVNSQFARIVPRPPIAGTCDSQPLVPARMRFVDLFAGMGGFHRALTSLGHECVFASEIDDELAMLYRRNFRASRSAVYGDIRISKDHIPSHDILCGGFPCQPFSKSGSQHGWRDRTRGTLFHEILEVLGKHRPRYVLLENVGNFERHNHGRTWKVVRESLVRLGYDVRGTTHMASGGHGLISPHHLGFPQTRERFFVVGSLEPLAIDPFPPRNKEHSTSLSDIVCTTSDLSPREKEEVSLTSQQSRCISHWNRFVKSIPVKVPLPSFPIWGDEIGASYPFKNTTPGRLSRKELLKHIGCNGGGALPPKPALLARLPSYARTEDRTFPAWKVRFIEQNREWLASVRYRLPASWVSDLQGFPPSLRKFEWNCQGEKRDLWQCVLQFRPSGLRAKRYTSSPALVAMTTTQIPILGPERRFLSRTEGLRLQGFPDTHRLPDRHTRAFSALGNAVHVGVVRAIAKRLFSAD